MCVCVCVEGGLWLWQWLSVFACMRACVSVHAAVGAFISLTAQPHRYCQSFGPASSAHAFVQQLDALLKGQQKVTVASCLRSARWKLRQLELLKMTRDGHRYLSAYQQVRVPRAVAGLQRGDTDC